MDDHPQSWNAHDSLGEAYLAAGRVAEARASYAESLRLNPENETARELLQE
ncbi:MAG TPA: tetratricopeptide repeat protein [Gemmatimonadota bacterium]|nr:tetratricopeptide repeat protein [Gemmatimonadota bacterium]